MLLNKENFKFQKNVKYTFYLKSEKNDNGEKFLTFHYCHFFWEGKKLKINESEKSKKNLSIIQNKLIHEQISLV